VRYDTRTGFPDLTTAGAGAGVGVAFCEADGVCFTDLIEDAALLVAVWIWLAVIGGALSSTSQLHYIAISDELKDQL